MNWQIWLIAIIAVALVTTFVSGSILSNSRHSLKATYIGTILEQPGDAMETARHSVLNAFYIAIGFIAERGGFGVWSITKYQL